MAKISAESKSLNAPRAHRRIMVSRWHGQQLSDPYAWLRAANWREVLKDPSRLPAEIARYLKAENSYTARWLSPLQGLQRELLREMRGRIKEDDTTPPSPDGPFMYYTRFRKGGQHRLYCRRSRGEAGTDASREQILLDADDQAKQHDYFSIGAVEHSPDHRLLAWSVDATGSELHSIHTREAGSDQDSRDVVAGTTGSIVWAADSNAFFYVRLDNEHRPLSVYRHRLGTPESADEEIYREADTGFFVGISRSQSGRHLIISSHDHETAEVHVLDLHDPGARPVCVAPRKAGIEYDVEVQGSTLLILTNADALDFRIMQAPLESPGREHWRDLVPHKPGRYIISFGCLSGWLIRLEREDGLPRIVCHDLTSGGEHDIAFDEEAFGLGLDLGYEYATTSIRFSYASLSRPAEIWDYDVVTRQRILLKRQDIPSGHDPAHYTVRRIMAPAKDGELVPVSLIHRRGMALDGKAPCLLYGYGAYGYAMSAAFQMAPLSLVDRGFTYAIAHVRGGSDKGRRWYIDGKREKKPNSFTDFIAAAEALQVAGYTDKGRIVAHGGSAGGMLMGAVANLAPELFAGVIADVPFVDVLNTMLDDSLPLTPPEWPEWGNPITDRSAFELIRAYSPYDQVKPQHYPAILALAGLADPRVTYWEPAKWVAALRHAMTGGGPVLLKTNMDAGHGGSSGRFDRLKETALSYAFAIAAANGDLWRQQPAGIQAKGRATEVSPAR